MVAGHFMETDKLDSPEDSMRSYRHRQLGETKGGSRDNMERLSRGTLNVLNVRMWRRSHGRWFSTWFYYRLRRCPLSRRPPLRFGMPHSPTIFIFHSSIIFLNNKYIKLFYLIALFFLKHFSWWWVHLEHKYKKKKKMFM